MTLATSQQSSNSASTAPPISIDNQDKTHPQMEKIETRFGEVQFLSQQAIQLMKGPIGFDEGQNFIFTKMPKDKREMYILMQSLDDKDISFICLPIPLSSSPYSAEDIQRANDEHGINPDHALWFSIINMNNDNGKVEIYANYGAPIIIDTRKQQGWQHIIPNPNYGVRTKIF